MPKGARSTDDQRLARLAAETKKLKAAMDKKVIPLGYMVRRAETLPTGKKQALASILFEVNDDKGDRERLLKVLGLPSEPQPVAPPSVEVSKA
jgi:hypothetical protein